MADSNRGVLYGAGAYLMWGLFPLYWPLLAPSGAVEILAHRMMWSLLTVLGILALRRHWRWFAAVLRSPRQLLLLTAAALVITANWGLFIYTVNSGHTLQAALGYFINPLVSVTLGVLVFSERLRRAQWAAVALGAVAVVVLTFDYGAPPWMALGMALTFAGYGVLKKFVRLDGVESLTVETMVMFLPALGYALLLHAAGGGTFGQVSAAHTVLLVGSGLVTAVPLLCFGAAAFRIPLSVLGLLQFIAPVLQFLIGWLVYGEEMPVSRWVGFGFVWVALMVFAADLAIAARRGSRDRAERPAPAAATGPAAEAPVPAACTADRP
ncbi:EamA family transporter RarD [Marinitenerispora sediminis]|uniref:EamA family transporter RarD n=1 Tax=Marinitenerispora sediminis TaxID=1931232 RepID=A0A368TDJ9_9ACTN|nr:EamA family transporter RarD [Marinitenerispora sediminis]RCV52858.1 EamA family transporter RarD [Marinitenerispora sediminis]RCV60034.1 EamA family transporter RarD [Marinitenerispora sediminis]RCV61941.1 EamA family transporter RarD [Marinitenerispora sediminis]